MCLDTHEWSRLEVDVVQGKSQAVACRSVAPLRIVNPRIREQSCHAILSNFGGGMVDGDDIYMQVLCRKGARLKIGSVGSLQVYRGSNGGSRQTIAGLLEPESLAVLETDPVALHRGSRFQQIHHWRVGTGANLLVAECLTGERVEAGDRFAFNEYISQFDAAYEGRNMIHDRFTLRPDLIDYRDPALFGQFTAFLTVYMVGNGWEPLASGITDAIASDSSGQARQLVASIHPLEDHGYILRALAEKSMHFSPLLERMDATLSSDRYLGFNPRLRKY